NFNRGTTQTSNLYNLRRKHFFNPKENAVPQDHETPEILPTQTHSVREFLPYLIDAYRRAKTEEQTEKQIKEEMDIYSKGAKDVKCIVPAPGMFRNFEIASVRDRNDFVQQASDIHAILQTRKPPEELNRALYPLL